VKPNSCTNYENAVKSTINSTNVMITNYRSNDNVIKLKITYL